MTNQPDNAQAATDPAAAIEARLARVRTRARRIRAAGRLLVGILLAGVAGLIGRHAGAPETVSVSLLAAGLAAGFCVSLATLLGRWPTRLRAARWIDRGEGAARFATFVELSNADLTASSKSPFREVLSKRLAASSAGMNPRSVVAVRPAPGTGILTTALLVLTAVAALRSVRADRQTQLVGEVRARITAVLSDAKASELAPATAALVDQVRKALQESDPAPDTLAALTQQAEATRAALADLELPGGPEGPGPSDTGEDHLLIARLAAALEEAKRSLDPIADTETLASEGGAAGIAAGDAPTGETASTPDVSGSRAGTPAPPGPPGPRADPPAAAPLTGSALARAPLPPHLARVVARYFATQD